MLNLLCVEEVFAVRHASTGIGVWPENYGREEHERRRAG
jgi:hypothetical protein